MVVCKFFLQGECRFGENCKFDHQIPSHNNIRDNFNSIYVNPARQPFQVNNEIDTATLVTSVRNDMLQIEKSGQWLLTCYAPFKEKEIFPGFHDQSFEEVRLGFYEAAKNNTLQQFKQQFQQALLEARTKFKGLQFFEPGTNITEQNSNEPKNIFGGSNINSKGSVFSHQANDPQNVSLFNQMSSSNNFVQASNSIFSNGNETVFGNQQNNHPSLLVKNQSNQQYGWSYPENSIFSSGNKSILASDQSRNNSLMNEQSNAMRQNLYRQNVQQQQSQQTLNMISNREQSQFSIFNNNSNKNSNTPLANSEKDVELLYSKIEELHESDISWFKGNDLNVEKMPEKPPTYEMCFS